MPAKPKPRRKLPNGTIAKLAAALQCSLRHTSTLVSLGCPTDPAQALEWRKAQHVGGGHDTAELLRQARVKLVTEQERRVKLENDVRAGHRSASASDKASARAELARRGATLSPSGVVSQSYRRQAK
jgi:hypothetical protein